MNSELLKIVKDFIDSGETEKAKTVLDAMIMVEENKQIKYIPYPVYPEPYNPYPEWYKEG